MSFVFFGCSGFSLIHAGFSVVAASEGYSSLHCMGFSLWWLLLLWSRGSKHASFSSCGSWALEHWLSSCGTWLSSFKACGIFLARRWNPCLLHWQVHSSPLSHQGSPKWFISQGEQFCLPLALQTIFNFSILLLACVCVFNLEGIF